MTLYAKFIFWVQSSLLSSRLINSAVCFTTPHGCLTNISKCDCPNLISELLPPPRPHLFHPHSSFTIRWQQLYAYTALTPQLEGPSLPSQPGGRRHPLALPTEVLLPLITSYHCAATTLVWATSIYCLNNYNYQLPCFQLSSFLPSVNSQCKSKRGPVTLKAGHIKPSKGFLFYSG